MKRRVLTTLVLAGTLGLSGIVMPSWAADVTGETVTKDSGTGNASGGAATGTFNSANNTLTVTGSAALGIAYGGNADKGQATDNTLNLEGGSVAYGYGGYSKSNDATGNTINVTGGNISNHLYGGYSDSGGSALNNHIEINQATEVLDGMNAGYVGGGSGDANYNTITITGSSLSKTPDSTTGNVTVTGAQNAGSGNLEHNTVIIDSTNLNGTEARAADRSFNVKGTADYNTLIIRNGSQTGYLCAAYQRYGDASHNTVTVTDSTIGLARGVYISKEGNVVNNEVSVTNSTVQTIVQGANTMHGYAAGNIVKLDGNTTVNWFVEGGYSGVYEGSIGAAGNQVIITGNVVVNNSTNSEAAVIGGYAGSSKTINGTTYTGKASAVGNSVTYDSMAGQTGVDVFGGYSAAGNAGEDGQVTVGGVTYDGGNTVKAAGNSTFQYIIGGLAEKDSSGNSGNADNNTVTFDGSDGAVSQLIYGGNSISGDANDNTVTVSHVTKDTPALDPNSENTNISMSNYNQIAGGVGAANASGNTVTVTDSRLTNQEGIYGGYTEKGSASDSTLTISGSTVEGIDEGVNIYGGYAMSGTEANNVKMTINNSTVTSICWVTAGTASSVSGTAKNNILSVTGSSLEAPAGEDAALTGNVAGVVTDNTVTVKDSAIKGLSYIFGTASGSESDNNTMTLDNTAVSNTWAVYGASSVKYHKLSGTAENNTFTINGGSISFDQASAEDYNYPTGGEADALAGAFAGNTAKNNTLTLNGTTVTGAKGIYGGESLSAANENTLTVTNTAISGETTIAGGKSNGWQGADADGNVTSDPSANGNKVVFSGDAISADDIYGGWIAAPNVDPDTSPYDTTLAGTTGTADSNTVNIISGVTAKEVIGGKNDIGGSASKNTVTALGGTISENLAGGLTKSGDASGNTLNISGGTIGTTENESETSNLIAGGYTSDGAATDNTVNVYSGILGLMMSLYGGYSTTESSGNTLNMYTKGNTVKNLGYFQALNFYVPVGTVVGETMLTVTGDADVSGAAVHGGVDRTTKMNSGDVINLIHDEGGVTTDGTSYGTISGMDRVTSGGFVSRLVTVKKQDPNTIVLTLSADSKPFLEPDTKILPEDRENAINTLKNAADLISNDAFRAAGAAWIEDHDVEAKFIPYAVVGGFDLHYNTGSYVDSNGMAANVGFVRRNKHEGHIDTIMPFMEYGKSHYASFLESGARGDGRQHYTGAGVLLRRDLTDGRYYEGAVRAGWLSGDFHGRIADTIARYDSGSPYFAAQAGMGKIYTRNRDTYDVYGKFFYTHLGSDTTTLHSHLGDGQYDFDAVNSYRSRLGLRWTRNFDSVRALYAGIGWDYEFDSKARASYEAYRTPSPSVKGASGFLELGWRSKIDNTHPWGIDVRATGWTGKQEGGTFYATISHSF